MDLSTNSNNNVGNAPTWETELGEYLPLCRAIQMGDWDKAQEFLSNDKDTLTGVLSIVGYRALHYAIGNPNNIVFIENLLHEINPELLPSLVNKDKLSALHYVAILDNCQAAEKLVEKNSYLLFTVENRQFSPVLLAAVNSHEKTFRYLLRMSKQYVELSQKEGYYNPFQGDQGVLLLGQTILAGFLMLHTTWLKNTLSLLEQNSVRFKVRYGVLQKCGICTRVPSDTTSTKDGYIRTCRRRKAYTMKLRRKTLITKTHIEPIRSPNAPTELLSNYGNFYYKNSSFSFYQYSSPVPHIKHLHEDKVKHNSALRLLKFTCEEVGKLKSDQYKHYADAFLVAVLNNIPEVVDQISRTFPQAVWVYDMKGYRFPQLSIINRSESVYNFFVHEVTHDKHLHNVLTDTDENNLLHLAGKLAPTHKLNQVTGAALRMRRELQWFQEVGKLMRPKEKEGLNKNGDTPIMVFRKEHKDLRQEGEEWMKKTADSYTITAALIITIVFAAAITVPGGNNEDTGKPIYKTRTSFIIFAVSDAISLFTSTTSLLLFLSILTARFAEDDFLYKLPKRLVLGLVMLFMSVTAMMIAFSATLYIMFGLDNSWVLIPIALLTCLPIASFVTLQLPLLVDLIASTYGPGIFVKGSEHRITS